MKVEGFEFKVDDLDGYRLIQTVFPAEVNFGTISVPMAAFLSLWDDITPTVLLADISALVDIPSHVHEVLYHILRRDESRSNLVASSWVVGDNDAMREMLYSLLPQVGRSIETVFAAHGEAVEYLRRHVEPETDGDT